MTLLQQSQIHFVNGITPKQKELINAYLQGAVYSWVKNRKDEWFAARDLFGGDNFYWEGTPLYCLYEKHINKGKSSNDAIVDAGKDLGWLLKQQLSNDKRSFETRQGYTAEYRWVGNEI